MVREPEVVPGRAEISVRVLDGRPAQVSVLPLHWNTDRSGAPRPDPARPVEGESGLYAAELWLMTGGAYGVEVTVAGEGGGSLLVPVNSLARIRRPMPRGFGVILGILAAGLAVGVMGIGAAAWREATLAPGLRPTRPVLRSLAGAVAGAVLTVAAVVGGARWWDSVDRDHENRVLFRPPRLDVRTEVRPEGTVLGVDLADGATRRPGWALLPDHGKLMHLFLVGRDASAEPVFVHLHPKRTSGGGFETRLPALPAGAYQVLAEVTHEIGVAQTLVAALDLDRSSPPSGWLDFEDSARLPGQGPGGDLGDGWRMIPGWADPPVAGRESHLEVVVSDADGRPAPLEPYLRMLGHCVVRRVDGRVFSHLHPAGNLSMAAARRFAARDGDEAARAADVVCGDLEAMPPAAVANLLQGGRVGFPVVFPEAGTYDAWVQVRIGGRVRTGWFRIEVGESR